MSQLKALTIHLEEIGSEEPWELLAKLTSLQQLDVTVYAGGDPSPLSALTALSFLRLHSLELDIGGPVPLSFSSLQPLSTLQLLEELHLDTHACDATSLQGLARLGNLRQLRLFLPDSGGRLRSLEGISPKVTDLALDCAPDLVSLAGIEGCTSLQTLGLRKCGVSSLQPLRGLSNMTEVCVFDCSLSSLAGLNSMSLQSLGLEGCTALTHLSGVGHLSALTSLEVTDCGVTSLQPLSQLGEGLQRLNVVKCNNVQEEIIELPHVQPTADVGVIAGNVKEVVLAGGERRACIDAGGYSDSDLD
jgi:Leucine-rich repeat (LRR) protein